MPEALAPHRGRADLTHGLSKDLHHLGRGQPTFAERTARHIPGYTAPRSALAAPLPVVLPLKRIIARVLTTLGRAIAICAEGCSRGRTPQDTLATSPRSTNTPIAEAAKPAPSSAIHTSTRPKRSPSPHEMALAHKPEPEIPAHNPCHTRPPRRSGSAMAALHERARPPAKSVEPTKGCET